VQPNSLASSANSIQAENPGTFTQVPPDVKRFYFGHVHCPAVSGRFRKLQLWGDVPVPRCNDGACTDAKSSSVTFSMFHATADIQGRFKTSRKRRVWKRMRKKFYFGMGLMVASSADRSERVNASGSSIQMQWPAFWIVSRRAFGRALTSLGQNVGPRST
jgi:hypothetical protein